jgi:multidrug efflux system membrane fusion protein
VKEGDQLITIDPEPYAAEFDRAKAQVLAAKARLMLAQKEQDRARRLQQATDVRVS